MKRPRHCLRETNIYLLCIDPKKNEYRQYAISCVVDELGRYVVVCSWGRVGQRQRKKRTLCSTTEQAMKTMRTHLLRRKRRGYSKLVGSIQPVAEDFPVFQPYTGCVGFQKELFTTADPF